MSKLDLAAQNIALRYDTISFNGASTPTTPSKTVYITFKGACGTTPPVPVRFSKMGNIVTVQMLAAAYIDKESSVPGTIFTNGVVPQEFRPSVATQTTCTVIDGGERFEPPGLGVSTHSGGVAIFPTGEFVFGVGFTASTFAPVAWGVLAEGGTTGNGVYPTPFSYPI